MNRLKNAYFHWIFNATLVRLRVSEVFVPTIQDKFLISDNALFNYLHPNPHQSKG